MDDAEALARLAVSTALGVEAQARQQADTAEAGARSGADQTLTSGLASEAQVRQAGVAAQTTRDTAQDQALSSEATARKTADDAKAATRGQAVSAEATARAGADTAEATARQQGDTAEAKTRSGADTAQAARLAALEAKAEEAAHFTASAALPAITALLPVTLTPTSRVPAKTGDVLKAGQSVSVEPATALPAGVHIASARVLADGQVAVQLTTGISIALQATPIVWNITALR